MFLARVAVVLATVQDLVYSTHSLGIKQKGAEERFYCLAASLYGEWLPRIVFADCVLFVVSLEE